MNKKLVILVLLVIILSISTTLLFYFGFVVIKTEKIEMDLTVGDTIGFNTDTDSIHFGTIYGGGESRRTIVIKNKNDFPITADIGLFGDFAGWVDVDDETLLVEPQGNSSVNFVARPPVDADYGTYVGYSTVVFKRKFT